MSIIDSLNKTCYKLDKKCFIKVIKVALKICIKSSKTKLSLSRLLITIYKLQKLNYLYK